MTPKGINVIIPLGTLMSIPESGKTVKLNLDLWQRAKVASVYLGESFRGFVEKAVERRLAGLTEGVATGGRRKVVEVAWPGDGVEVAAAAPAAPTSPAGGSDVPSEVQPGVTVTDVGNGEVDLTFPDGSVVRSLARSPNVEPEPVDPFSVPVPNITATVDAVERSVRAIATVPDSFVTPTVEPEKIAIGVPPAEPFKASMVDYSASGQMTPRRPFTDQEIDILAPMPSTEIVGAAVVRQADSGEVEVVDPSAPMVKMYRQEADGIYGTWADGQWERLSRPFTPTKLSEPIAAWRAESTFPSAHDPADLSAAFKTPHPEWDVRDKVEEAIERHASVEGEPSSASDPSGDGPNLPSLGTGSDEVPRVPLEPTTPDEPFVTFTEIAAVAMENMNGRWDEPFGESFPSDSADAKGARSSSSGESHEGGNSPADHETSETAAPPSDRALPVKGDGDLF